MNLYAIRHRRFKGHLKLARALLRTAALLFVCDKNLPLGRHSVKLKKPRAMKIMKLQFSHKLVHMWNKRSAEMVSALTVELLRDRFYNARPTLDRFLLLTFFFYTPFPEKEQERCTSFGITHFLCPQLIICIKWLYSCHNLFLLPSALFLLPTFQPLLLYHSKGIPWN